MVTNVAACITLGALCFVPVANVVVFVVTFCFGSFQAIQCWQWMYQRRKHRKLLKSNQLAYEWKDSVDKISDKLETMSQDVAKIEDRCSRLKRSITSQNKWKIMLDKYELDNEEEVVKKLERVDQSLLKFSADCKKLLAKITETQHNLRE